MKSLFLLLLLAVSAHANDCVPLAFQTLSASTGRPVPYDRWMKRLMPDGVTTPNLIEALEGWRKEYPSRPLVCVFSRVPGLPIQVDRDDLEMNRPYFWVGAMPAKMIEQMEGGANSHAAVIYKVSEGRYRVMTALEPSGKTWFVEYFLSGEELVARTFVIFEIAQPRPF